MVNARDPLRHAHVIGVFGLELKLEESARGFAHKLDPLAANAAIRRNAGQIQAAISDQTQRDFIIRESGIRSAENCANQVVVHVRGAQRELGLLKSRDAEVMPRALLKRCKRRRMALDKSGVGFLHAMNVAEEFGTE